MMKNTVETGKNRTGIALSPLDKQELIEGALATIPSMEGDASELDVARAPYLEDRHSIGSMPPPASVKGVASTVADAVKGASASVFLDKLGERLAFERTGTRLYTTLLGKFDASDPLPGGPTRADLERIQQDEISHFLMLREAMLSLGADPTAITPSADVAAVSSMGILQVVGDARMNLKQSLEAILVAELVDNDGWGVLIELARATGHQKLADRFETALAAEEEHLANVRTWIRRATIGEGKPIGTPEVTS